MAPEAEQSIEYPGLNAALDEIPTHERAARMIEVNMGYAAAYMNGDFERMLDFLVDVPEFEFFPPGIRITGRAAVLERSRRMYAVASQNDSRTAGDTHEIRASTHGENMLIHEFSNVYTLPDGSRKRCYTVAVIPFVGDKMVGERIYSDAVLGAMRDQALGDDFYARPDVIFL